MMCASSSGRRWVRWSAFAAILGLAGVLVPAWAAGEGTPRLEAWVLAGPEPKGAVGELRADGSYVLRAAGRDRTDAVQEGSLAGVHTRASHFTFVCRVVKAPRATPDPQYGVTVRAGHEGTEKCVNLRYDGREPYRCWRWWMRHHVTPSSHDGSGRAYLYGYDTRLRCEENLWLKIVRRYPFVYLYTSRDGRQWEEFGADYLKVLMPQEVWVGPTLTAGGDGKTTAEAVFDNISFTVDAPEAPALDFEHFLAQEYHPPVRPRRLYLAQVPMEGKGGDAFSPLLVMPRGMDPRQIRALLWTAGTKEVLLADGTLPFDKGEGLRRKPSRMKQWEGVLELSDMHHFSQILEHYHVVRLGGFFPPQYYPQAVDRLARISGIRFLPNIPFVVTGASFAGGYSAAAAERFPEKTIASAPVIIGMAGAKTESRAVLDTPHLYVFGSHDGSHLKDALQWIPDLRRRHALWAAAPMWRVYHRQHRSFGIILPYFLECIRLRVPEKTDYTRAPVHLKTLREQDGWYGLVETWQTNYPQVVRARAYRGSSANLVWLPSELTARLWQSFVSQNPRTIIHFPMFEGHNNYGQANPHGWHNSYLEADKPFELVASGPLGEGLEVQYYADLKPLEVLSGGPYRVRLEGVEPGLHFIYAVTKLGNYQEISRPVVVMFQRRQ